jgi:hypothetical protein
LAPQSGVAQGICRRLLLSAEIVYFNLLQMQKVDSEQLKELDRLKDWSLTILRFINTKTPSGSMNYVGKFEEVVTQTYDKKDLRGMKLLFKDVIAWSKDLEKEQITELNKIIRKKFGEDLYYSHKKIEEILSKAVIENLAEYKLLFDYFEEINSDESRNDEISRVNRLIEEYQEKKRESVIYSSIKP